MERIMYYRIKDTVTDHELAAIGLRSDVQRRNLKFRRDIDTTADGRERVSVWKDGELESYWFYKDMLERECVFG